MDAAKDDVWVFGYGSLMWRPGFPCQELAPGLLRGYHRSFCVWSRHWRGTPQRPGLVLGLAPDGECQGLLFRVAASDWEWVKAYLDERELVSYAYAARWLPVETAAVAGGAVQAYTYVADPWHPQYAGEMTVEKAIETLRRMAAEGFADEGLRSLLRRVEYLTGILESGGGI